MRFDVVTLFPDMLRQLAEHGVCGRAIRREIVQLVCWNPRDYTYNVHHTVDDRPYGGGPGMVMKYEPLAETLAAVREQNRGPVVYLSPQGPCLVHDKVVALAKEPALVLVAGRYEGVDQRFLDDCIDEELSIGDYVLSGGELAAMVVVDAVSRQLPGTLGHAESACGDSFAKGLLDWPHYTRPEKVAGKSVPPVLLSGDHKAIEHWRLKQALGHTWLLRPDLLQTRVLEPYEQALLNEFLQENDKLSE